MSQAQGGTPVSVSTGLLLAESFPLTVACTLGWLCLYT